MDVKSFNVDSEHRQWCTDVVPIPSGMGLKPCAIAFPFLVSRDQSDVVMWGFPFDELPSQKRSRLILCVVGPQFRL